MSSQPIWLSGNIAGDIMKRKLTALFAAMAAVSMLAAGVGATQNPGGGDGDGGQGGGETTTQGTGTNYSATLVTHENNYITSFDKYLVMKKEANVPNAEFSYTIVPYPTDTTDKRNIIVPAADGKLAVIKGVEGAVFKANDSENTGTSEAGKIKFVQADTATSVVEGTQGTTETVVWNDTTTGNERYAKKTITLDFSAVQFTEPGVYRYLITEANPAQQGISYDIGVTSDGNNTFRTLDVYVTDYSDFYNKLSDKTGYDAPTGKQLFIEGYIMYEGKHGTAPSVDGGEDVAGKSKSYTNSYTTYDLTFGKEITGNRGSKDKYFKLTLKIENAIAGTKYDVELMADASVPSANDLNTATDPSYAGKLNPTSITVPEGETSVSTDYYLQDGQYITVKGLAKDTKYTLSEVAEDYTPTNGISADNSSLDWDTSESAPGNDALMSDAAASTTKGTITGTVTADVHTGFTNDRSGSVPTGIITKAAAPAGVGIAVLAGIIALAAKRRKEDEE